MDRDSLKKGYIEAATRYSGLADREEKKLFLISILRLVTFAGGIVLSWLAFTTGVSAGTIVSLISVILFVWLLKMYSRHSSEKQYLRNLAIINSTEAKVLEGDLSSLKSGDEYSEKDHPFSSDIDLFGNSSLFQYVNRTVTGPGRNILAAWLSDPYPLAEDLEERQKAVKELSEKTEWRQDFIARGMISPVENRDMVSLKEWVEGKSPVRSRFHRYLIFILPSATMLALGLLIAGVLHYTVFNAFITINLLYVFSGIRKTGRLHNTLSKRYLQMDSIAGLLALFENESFESQKMKDMQSCLAGEKGSAAIAVRQLGDIIRAFDSRLNLIAGILLNAFLLWDYHCVRRLEEWKQKYQSGFGAWLQMAGEADAYISLGNYCYNNPSFTFPVISEGEQVFSAESAGHPLLDGKERVCNNFSIEKEGQICVITGANMAGKSTFLRTIAVNLLLGMCGAPVCAGRMTFRPMMIFTSMRTTDSLSGHESYFYAELKRLKMLKTLTESGSPVLFILDEILKGTNSNDKSLGSALFVKRLIESKGTGLIATHDISLGELEKEYPGIVFNKCFEVEINHDKISFDYILRDGITTKMNAAILMKQMGILD